MGTSVVRFTTGSSDTLQWGVLKGASVHTLAVTADRHREIMDLYYADRPAFDAVVAADGIDESSVEFHAPLSREIQLIAQGINYATHRKEGGLKADAEDEENLIFMKASSTISKPNETILRPKGCVLLDYEIELGIVLKTDVAPGTKVTNQNLGDYVGGLILCNDVSSRDFMFGAPALQWYKGKSQRTFCPVGPVLYLLDEGDISKLYSLQMTLRLNGEVRQSSLTDLMIHKPPATITELATFTDLSCGDCIITGTPGGVCTTMNLKTGLAILLNMKNDKKRREKFIKAQLAVSPYLQPGDILELEMASTDGSIDLGKQRNEIADA
jgi:2-keto-4-pentenoate hydratase/2-oxohepta-3-ene-1,7-dioic acid hydratase in catechol pathway